MLSKRTKQPVNDSGPLMYIGPTIPGLVATATVFNNGIPEAFTAKAQECISLSELLVPIDKVAEKTREIQKGIGATSVFYQRVCAYFFEK